MAKEHDGHRTAEILQTQIAQLERDNHILKIHVLYLTEHITKLVTLYLRAVDGNPEP